MFRKKGRKKISTRPKREEKPSVFFKIAYFLLLFSFFGVTAYILFFSHFLQITHLNLEGVEELEYEKVYGNIESEMSGKYLGIIPKDNFILVYPNKIKRSLSGEFKKIRKIEIQKTFPDTMNVKIEEREALILWCAKGPCYIIDGQGYAYSAADFESEEIQQNNLIRLIDTGAKPVEIGEKILKKDYVDFIFNVRESFKKETNIEIFDEYQTKLKISGEIQIKTSEGWNIYLSSELPLEQSVRTLKAFLEKEVSEETRKDLEYVDLRVENKVFYKSKSPEGENGEKEGEEGQSGKDEKDESNKKKDN